MHRLSWDPQSVWGEAKSTHSSSVSTRYSHLPLQYQTPGDWRNRWDCSRPPRARQATPGARRASYSTCTRTSGASSAIRARLGTTGVPDTCLQIRTRHLRAIVRKQPRVPISTLIMPDALCDRVVVKDSQTTFVEYICAVSQIKGHHLKHLVPKRFS